MGITIKENLKGGESYEKFMNRPPSGSPKREGGSCAFSFIQKTRLKIFFIFSAVFLMKFLSLAINLQFSSFLRKFLGALQYPSEKHIHTQIGSIWSSGVHQCSFHDLRWQLMGISKHIHLSLFQLWQVIGTPRNFLSEGLNLKFTTSPKDRNFTKKNWVKREKLFKL